MNEGQVLALLAKALQDANVKANTANFNTAQIITGPGGMFSVPGAEPDIISTHVQPQGLGAELPVYPSNLDDPRFPFITGFSASQGSEPVYPCDDAPKGYMKGGYLTASFGRIMRQTETIEIDKILHQQRGAPTNLRLMGTLIGNSNFNPVGANPSQLLNLVVHSEMVGVGVQMERKMAQLLWQGTAANNTAGGGYKEFPGLDYQVATGHIDAESSVALPSADSLIYDFAYNDIGGTTLDIVEYVSMMEYQLRDLATRTGLMPVTWAIVMRPDVWFELSAIWPCRYLSNRCNVDGTSAVVINDNANVAMRDAMRTGMYLDVNGRRYRVILDDGVYEHTNITSGSVPAGSYASSIYFIPLTVRGGFPVTYWEHVDYRGVQAELAPMGAGARHAPFWSTEGRFLWVYRDNGFCFDLQAKVEPRVVLRTPHLAGKIQSVRYTPMTHLRDSQPSSPYWVNGGVSLRGVTPGAAVWR